MKDPLGRADAKPPALAALDQDDPDQGEGDEQEDDKKDGGHGAAL
jgi:hypothetical protein